MLPESLNVVACPKCGMQLPPAMLACPSCGRLVHADRLAALAQAAREATDRGDITGALTNWREALPLLPATSKQYEVISATITELGNRLPAGAIFSAPSKGEPSRGFRPAAGIGALALSLFKFKAIFLGLTKGTTILSMLLSLGVYWTAWGWQFALGIVLSIYIHEMGHVIALRSYGFQATAPMFIPGLGALIRLQQRIVNPNEDAAIGLAGPIYGLGAALFSLVLWWATSIPVFAAIAGVGAWINLFNLLPIASLDGSRGFHAMSRGQKLLAAGSAGAASYLAHDGMLLLVALIGAGRALGDKPTPQQSWKATVVYCLLIASLTALSLARFLVRAQ